MKQVRVTEPLLLADEVIEPGLNPAILPLSLLAVLRELTGEFTSFSGMVSLLWWVRCPDPISGRRSGGVAKGSGARALDRSVHIFSALLC